MLGGMLDISLLQNELQKMHKMKKTTLWTEKKQNIVSSLINGILINELWQMP
jgi:hypothetical protein